MALEEIIANTRREVAARKASRPDFGALPPSDRSLADALRRPRTGFVMECKKASPSRGLIRADFDPATIARAYAPFADAISVLTDATYFQGDHAFLRIVRDNFDGPVLCKDFVVDPWQIAEARSHGADAILLMLSVLDDATWRACKAAADTLGIDCLTEVHDETEAARACALGAPIIGVNNRDLKTLRTNLDTTARLLPHLPDDALLICESGIETHRDVLRYRDQVAAFLVGTSLMRQPDLDAAIRRLVFGDVKVCGLTRPADARAAWEAGATWGGLIFAPESPRHIPTLDAAAAIRAAAPLRWVGVFVNARPDTIDRAARELGLVAVQLHGEETPADIARLRDLLPGGTQIWKAQRVRDRVDLQAAAGADSLLLDTFSAGRRGGTGHTFDWSLLDPLRQQGLLPQAGMGALSPNIALSGGLNPNNLAEADTVGTALLDLNSGMENAPGHKDPTLLHAAFAALRG